MVCVGLYHSGRKHKPHFDHVQMRHMGLIFYPRVVCQRGEVIAGEVAGCCVEDGGVVVCRLYGNTDRFRHNYRAALAKRCVFFVGNTIVPPSVFLVCFPKKGCVQIYYIGMLLSNPKRFVWRMVLSLRITGRFPSDCY